MLLVILHLLLAVSAVEIDITPIKNIKSSSKWDIALDYHNTSYSIAPACYITTMNETCTQTSVYNSIEHNLTISYDSDVLDLDYNMYYADYTDAEVFFKLSTNPNSSLCKNTKCIARLLYNNDEIYLGSYQNNKPKVLYHKFHVKQNEYRFRLWIMDINNDQQWDYEIYMKNQKVYRRTIPYNQQFSLYGFTYLNNNGKLILYPSFMSNHFVLIDEKIPIIFRAGMVVMHGMSWYSATQP